MKIIKYLPMFLFFILFLGQLNVLGCTCSIQTSCQAFSEAQSVFVGKLEKIERIESENTSIFVTTFLVERTFKGTNKKVEQIKFEDCGNNKDFKMGERFFVYKENAAINSPCNPTHLLGKDDAGLKYAKNLLKNTPGFTISGLILLLSEAELKKVKVIIENGKQSYIPIVDRDGNFSFRSSKRGIFHIKIILPFQAQVFVSSGNVNYNVKTSITRSETILEYDLEFRLNECIYREFNITKVE